MQKKILFIEDESALQKTAQDVLSRDGYKMLSAADGEGGLIVARAEKPDLILLDLVMPKMSGFDALKQLKEDKETKDIPVVILTNLEGKENMERAFALGAADYLVKANCTLEEVIQKIEKILKK